MAGLDISAKLRRSLGQGSILSDEEVAEQLSSYDADGDGRVSKLELSQYFVANGLGGPWFCEMFATTIWRKVDQSFEEPIVGVAISALGRAIHQVMSQTQRPTRRYVITPEVFRGEAPRLDLADKPVDELTLSPPVPRTKLTPTRTPSARPGSRTPVRPSPSRPIKGTPTPSAVRKPSGTVRTPTVPERSAEGRGSVRSPTRPRRPSGRSR